MAEEAPRATWNFLYEKGLIEILTGHKLDARFKGQNGWNSDGWRSITTKFNEKYPMAHFTKQQLQDKEKDIKASFKAINNAKKESGVGWNESMGMIVADPHLWEKCASKFPKIKKHRKNGFPLFRSCEALYAGSIATGSLSFASTELQPLNPPPAEPVDPPAEPVDPPAEPAASDNAFSVINAVNAFSIDGHEASEAQSAPTGTSAQPGSGKKRKQSQVAAVLDDYLEHKKKRSEKTIEVMVEKKNQEEEYSIEKCLDTVDAMEELTDEEKAIASEVFENDINRQMFMKQKNLNVRLIWLRRKIRLANG